MYQTPEDRLQRIAIVSEDMSRPLDEGFKKATVYLTRALKDLIPKTTVFTHSPGRAAVEAEHLPANKLLYGTDLARRLRALDPDVVIYIPGAAATSMSMVRARWLKRQSGGKPVALVSLQQRSYPVFAGLLLKAFRPDLVLALSSPALDMVRRLGCRARRMVLGVDSEVFRPPAPGAVDELRAKYNLPGGKIILHVGHLSPGRNLGVLKTIAGKDTRMLVVSSTATRRDARVETMLREPWVILMRSYVEHIEEVYRAVDGYIFPTFSPIDAIDIPLSVLEALATNLPVATTDFGGLRDVLVPGAGLFICSTESELIQAGSELTTLQTIATRDKVLGLTWKHAAESVLDIIAEELE
jgi:glycosyltransferase involved in cell wall biosynthesis